MCLKTAVPYLPSRSWINSIVILLCLFIITACGGGGGDEATEAENPEAAPPPPPAKIVCNDGCRNEGQCGENADGQPVVLGNADQPETRAHNQLFPHDADVNILDSRDMNLLRPAETEPFPLAFYLVQLVGENPQTGWVASWCIAQP